MGFFDRFRNRKDVGDRQPDPTPVTPESKLVPFVGRVPFPAYRGNEPYVFVSYAHVDADKVFTLIKQFYDQGYHVWYDEGIAPGKEWSAQIERALAGCAVFVVMVTGRSVGSPNVRDEIEFALDEGKPFVAIHLEPTDLPAGLRLRMGRRQAILKHAMSEGEYVFKYTEAFSQFGLPMPTPTAMASQETPHDVRSDAETRATAQVGAMGESVTGSQSPTDTSAGAMPSQKSAPSLQAQAAHSTVSGVTPAVTRPKGVAVVSDGVRAYTKDGRHMETYVQEDSLTLFALDEFGPVEISPSVVEHIDFVHDAGETMTIPTPPVARHATGDGEIPGADEDKRHVWGDYEPKGVAHITMADGRALQGVANSFVLRATHMEKNAGSGECLYGGMDSPHLDDPDYKLSDMKSFLDLALIENEGDHFVVTDYDEEETSICLPDGAEFWYLGAESKFEPCKVKATDVREIRFARGEEPGIPIRWCTVRCEEGSFRSPAAFLTVRVNTNRGGAFPSMRLSHEFTLYSGYPCRTRSLLKLVVTKPGKNGGPFAAPSEMGFKASLKNGEDIDFVMDGYFAIYVMSRFGIMRTLPRDKFQRIDFEG